MDANAPRPRRRWLQFSLRSVLLLVTVLALLMAWLGQRFNLAREQRQAVDAILAAGGAQVHYDYHAAGEKEPPGPKWLRRLTGNDLFQRVEYVAFRKSTPDFSTLRRLPNLKGLSIQFPASIDCDISRLADLHSLEGLDLRGNGFTDSNLLAVSGLKNLQSLTLESTNITDAGLGHLQGLPKLRELHLITTRKEAAENRRGLDELRKSLPNLTVKLDWVRGH